MSFNNNTNSVCYLFNISPDILFKLSSSLLTTADIDDEEVTPPNKEISRASGKQCSLCQVQFDTIQEQRQHFKSREHAETLQKNVAPPGASEEDDEGSSNDESEQLLEDADNLISGSPLVRLNCPDFSLQFYRSTIVSDREKHQRTVINAKEALHRLQKLQNDNSFWMILIFSAGDFAAAIFDNRCSPGGQSGGKPILHKTFHRYTVRKKQGGSQSTRDSAGGNKIKSAGSSLRRRNEQQLQSDIQYLFETDEWVKAMAKCSRIYRHCPGHVNKPFLDRLLQKQKFSLPCEDIICSIPMTIRKCNLAELEKVHDTLSHVAIISAKIIL